MHVSCLHTFDHSADLSSESRDVSGNGILRTAANDSTTTNKNLFNQIL